jgi:hypothetical protein
VGFQNVNHVERYAILILLVQLVELGNLPAKWWSSIASEDQDDWFRSAEGRERDFGGFVQGAEMEIRGLVTDVERSGAGAQPQCFEREEQERRSGEFRDSGGEAFRRLAHGDVDCGQEDEPER